MGVLRRGKLQGVSKVDWWNAFPSAILAVLVSALLTIALFGNLAIGLVLCGALSVFFYRQRNKIARITKWVGVRLGAISGALGLGIVAAFPSKLELHQMAAQAMQMAIERNTDPAAKQVLQDMAAQHPGAIFATLIISMGLVFLLISGLGGLLGAILINRWRPQVNLVSGDTETNLEQREKTERSEHE